MRLNYLITILTTIALFDGIGSEALNVEEDNDAVCYETVTETRTRVIWRGTKCDDLKSVSPWTYDICISQGKKESYSVPYVKQVCCAGYEKKGSKCVPRCSPECKDSHYCARPNECRCNNEENDRICNETIVTSSTDKYDKITCGYGWEGKFCSESLYCVIINTVEDVTTTEGQKNHRSEIDRDSNDILTLNNRTECLPTCLSLTSLAVNFTHYGNTTYYFLPIELRCNMKADFKYQVVGSSLLGIVCLAIIVIFFVYFVRRYRRPDNSIMDVETVNSIEYDDVGNHENLSEETIKYEYDYVYDHRRLPERQTK